jgi:hypothetical protein
MYEWLEYQTIENTTFMYCSWCECAKFTNLMAKGTTTYKKDTLDRHYFKIKESLNVRKKNCYLDKS